jgi:23S rRNA (uracil1939-C5)-methyltransferase
VYISCNPATLIRDLVKFEGVYEIKEIIPVDMFPFTSNVECVACLELKQTLDK